jgi:hypothetical protein
LWELRWFSVLVRAAAGETSYRFEFSVEAPGAGGEGFGLGWLGEREAEGFRIGWRRGGHGGAGFGQDGGGLADAFDALANGGERQRIEFVQLFEFGLGYLDDAEETVLFKFEAAEVLGVLGDAVGVEGVDGGDAGGGHIGEVDLAGLFEAGFEFEGLELGVAEQASLGVDDALDEVRFDAVGGSEDALVLGGHFAVGGGVFAGDEGESGAGAEVDGDGAGAVFEAVETGVGFAGGGLGAGALLGVLAIDLGAAGLFRSGVSWPGTWKLLGKEKTP